MSLSNINITSSSLPFSDAGILYCELWIYLLMKLTNHLNWSRVLDDEQRKPENRIRAYKLRQNLPRIINRRSSPEPKMSKAYCGYLS
jgi:hypothetical protein